MKVQIIYASRSGSTEKVANAIYDAIEEEKSIHDLRDGIPVLDGDIIIAGYWGTSGGPDKQTQEFLRTIQNKAVGIFATLGYYADSVHAFDTVQKGVELVKDTNEVIGSYVCNGHVARELKKDCNPEKPTEQKQIRWEILESHPSRAECTLAAERFRERITLYRRCRTLGIPFSPVL